MWIFLKGYWTHTFDILLFFNFSNFWIPIFNFWYPKKWECHHHKQYVFCLWKLHFLAKFELLTSNIERERVFLSFFIVQVSLEMRKIKSKPYWKFVIRTKSCSTKCCYMFHNFYGGICGVKSVLFISIFHLHAKLTFSWSWVSPFKPLTLDTNVETWFLLIFSSILMYCSIYGWNMKAIAIIPEKWQNLKVHFFRSKLISFLEGCFAP